MFETMAKMARNFVTTFVKRMEEEIDTFLEGGGEIK